MRADAAAPAVLAVAPDAVMLADARAPAVLAGAPLAVMLALPPDPGRFAHLPRPRPLPLSPPLACLLPRPIALVGLLYPRRRAAGPPLAALAAFAPLLLVPAPPPRPPLLAPPPWVSGGNTAYTVVQTNQRVRDREFLHTHAAFRTREFVAYAPRRGLFNGGADGVGMVRDG